MFKHTKRLLLAALLSFTLISPVAALAQDTVPEPVPLEDNVTTPPASDSLPGTEEPDVPLTLFLTAPLTLLIVSFLKRIPALDAFPATTLTGLVAVALWLAFLLARAAGYETQFNSISDFLETALPALAELIFALLGSTALYQVARTADTPVVGYQRPLKRQSSKRAA